MKKILCVLLAIACMYATAIAQGKENKIRNKGKSNLISAGVDIPFGAFSGTHSFGGGIDYSWSHHRFGLLNATPENLIGFTSNLGTDYYFGKKEMIGPYTYKYSAYTYFHAYAGIIYNPCTKGNISLSAGPALGLYNSQAQFNFGINLNGRYYFGKKIAISPAITFMKESESNPLWTITLQISYCF